MQLAMTGGSVLNVSGWSTSERSGQNVSVMVKKNSSPAHMGKVGVRYLAHGHGRVCEHAKGGLGACVLNVGVEHMWRAGAVNVM